MKDDKKVPQLRFPEFTDAWKQRKFSEVFEEYSEKKHPELPALTIIQGKGTILRDASDRNLLYDKANLASYKLVRKDDFIVHLRTFEGGLEKANSDGIVSPAYHIFHGKNTDTRFFYPFFRSKYFIDALLKPHVYGIRDGKSIDIEGMKTISFLVPSFEEQNKIGKFVETLDNTITLQQRKLNSLQKLKKGLLQKMFPKKGENIPEIRFPEFSDAWKQRELGEIAERVTRRNSSLESQTPLTISAEYGLIDQNKFFGKRIAAKDLSNYYLIQKGEFAYNKSTSNDAPWGAIKRLDCYNNGALSTLYIVFKIKDNKSCYSDFLVTYYGTSLWHKGVKEIATEGARNHGLLNVSPSDFFRTKLVIPQDFEEQRKIGAFFTQLDNTITLQQRKLESLQKLKKGLLQQMFI